MTTETGEISSVPETVIEPPTETTTEVPPTPEVEKPVEAPAEYVPLTAEALKFPEGAAVNEPLRDEFLTVINNQELSPEARAQGLVDLYLKSQEAASEQGSEAWNATQAQWQADAKADPEIGGDKLEPALVTVSRAIEKFGSPELRQVMDLTGAGNHPAMIKFLFNMAKQFNEGGPVTGSSAAGEASLADKLFPSMSKG